MHTPSVLLNVLRHLSADIRHVLPQPHQHQWNPYVFASYHNHPFLVLECRGTKFSVGRVRSDRGPWKYRLFWPFGQSEQQCQILGHPHDVVRFIQNVA